MTNPVDFKIGTYFKGKKSIFEVINIYHKKRKGYKNKVYFVKEPTVSFRDIKNNKIYEADLETLCKIKIKILEDKMFTLKTAPLSVVENVKNYFKNNLNSYAVICVFRKHSEDAADNDNNLYFVIGRRLGAKDDDSAYTAWTCWNESTKSLNYGHYMIPLAECIRKAVEECDTIPLTYKSNTGRFIRTSSDLLNLDNRERYSFLVNEVHDMPVVDSFALNQTKWVLIALITEFEEDKNV